MFYNCQTKQHFKLPEEPRTGSGLTAEERGASCSALPAALDANHRIPGAEGKLLLRGAGCRRKGRPGIGSLGGWADRPEGPGLQGHPAPPHRRVWKAFKVKRLDKGGACVSLPPLE